MELSDKEWEVIEPLMQEPPSGKQGRPWRGNREVLDGILWVLRTGGPLAGIYLKSIHPIKLVIVVFNNGHRMEHFKGFKWHSQKSLKSKKKINMSECCIDAKFVPAKKGGTCVGKTKCGKGTKLVAITEKRGRPVGVLITDASCHEVRLVEPALDACWTFETPAVLIGDKAYDSDPLDASLRGRGVDMVAPHKKNRKKPSYTGWSSFTTV